jgi:hypothetical protein
MTLLVAAELDRALEFLLKSYLAPGKARDEYSQVEVLRWDRFPRELTSLDR